MSPLETNEVQERELTHHAQQTICIESFHVHVLCWVFGWEIWREGGFEKHFVWGWRSRTTERGYWARCFQEDWARLSLWFGCRWIWRWWENWKAKVLWIRWALSFSQQIGSQWNDRDSCRSCRRVIYLEVLCTGVEEDYLTRATCIPSASPCVRRVLHRKLSYTQGWTLLTPR